MEAKLKCFSYSNPYDIRCEERSYIMALSIMRTKGYDTEYWERLYDIWLGVRETLWNRYKFLALR